MMSLVLMDSGAEFGGEAMYTRAKVWQDYQECVDPWGCHFTSANESVSSGNPEEM